MRVVVEGERINASKPLNYSYKFDIYKIEILHGHFIIIKRC